MRKTNSQFDLICQWVNAQPIGSTFTPKDFVAAVGHYENLTAWKRWNGNPHYVCHMYKGYLKRTGFLSNPSRGVWVVEKRIPSWLTLGHLQCLIGWTRWDYKNNKPISLYGGMNQEGIRQKLAAENC